MKRTALGRQKRGVTLVEVLGVVAIMAAISGVVPEDNKARLAERGEANICEA